MDFDVALVATTYGEEERDVDYAAPLTSAASHRWLVAWDEGGRSLPTRDGVSEER